jgi:hypothetical protein
MRMAALILASILALLWLGNESTLLFVYAASGARRVPEIDRNWAKKPDQILGICGKNAGNIFRANSPMASVDFKFVAGLVTLGSTRREDHDEKTFAA